MSVIIVPRSIKQPSVSLMKPPRSNRVLAGGSPGEQVIVAPPGVSLPQKAEFEALTAAPPLPVADAVDAADAADQQECPSDEETSSPTLGGHLSAIWGGLHANS